MKYLKYFLLGSAVVWFLWLALLFYFGRHS